MSRPQFEPSWPVRAMLAACSGIVLLSTLAGCAIDRVRAENDRLREEVMVLEDELNRAQGRLAELSLQVRRLADEADGAAVGLPEIAEVEPLVTVLEIGRLSHAVDSDLDGLADLLVLYVVPKDGRGRFTQLAGSLEARTVCVDRSSIRSLGECSLDAVAVRDAYRSSFMGTHYTIEVPIAADASAESVGAVVMYTDGRTGAHLRAERQIDLRAPRVAKSSDGQP